MALCAMSAHVSPAAAQDISRFEFYGSEEGLSQSSVYSLFCDDNGFLWIGTNNGLNRFDGKSFKEFSHTMSRDLSSDGEPNINGRIERIWGDSHSYVWQETYDGHYRFFNQRTERFGILPAPKDGVTKDEATAFVQFNDDIVVVGTERSGVFILRYDEAQGQYVRSSVLLKDKNGRVRTVLSLHVDEGSTLWIVTNDGVASLTKQQMLTGQYEPMEREERRMTGAVCETPQRVLFGTKGKGIWSYNKDTDVLGGHVANPVIGDSVDVTMLEYVNGKGQLIATSDARLLRVTPSGYVSEVKYHGQHTDAVEKIFVDAQSNAWVTTVQKGVTKVNVLTGESKFYEFTSGELASSIDQERPFFYEDSEKHLWVCLHGGGLLLYDTHRDEFVAWHNDMNDPNSLPSNVVHCMAEDKAGNLWVGTGQYPGGLVKVLKGSKAFKSVTPNMKGRTHTENVVRAVMSDRAGHLWVATKGCDIFVYDSDNRIVSHAKQLRCTDGSTVMGMAYGFFVARDGRLWIATKGKGILVSSKPVDFARVNLEAIEFVRIDRHVIGAGNGAFSVSFDYVYSLAQDANGAVWAASYGAGLFRIRMDAQMRPTVDVFNSENSGLLSDKVRYVMVDRKGSLWIASVNGVNSIKPHELALDAPELDRYTYKQNSPSIGYNDICHIFEDEDGSLYFATLGRGISVLETNSGQESFVEYTTKDGLCNNTVYSIAQDSKGDIWIATSNGLSCLNRAKGSFESFNVNKGLGFNSFSESTVCGFNDGTLVFGGYSGFTRVNPMEVSKRRFDEKIMITDIFVNNSELRVGDENSMEESVVFAESITLEHWQSNITIRFASMDFTDPRSASYSYMLEGLDSDWNYVGNDDRAVYTNLSPGDYKLHIRHMTSDGVWSEKSRVLSICIKSPCWLSVWAYVIYALLLALIAYAAYRIWHKVNDYKQRIKVENRLNDVKLQFFTNIAHEIRTPLTLIVSPIDALLGQQLRPEVKQQMLTIKRNADRLLKLVSQLLEFRKVQDKKVQLMLRHVDLCDVVRQSANAFSLVASQKKIDFKCDIPDALTHVWVDVDEMDTVFYNLLSNAFKFTDSGKQIEVRVSQTETHTIVEVADQGRGIAQEAIDELFQRYTILSSNDLSGTGIGLSLSHSLVELHRGHLTVSSQLGVGTTFRVEIPNGKRHFEGDTSVTFVNDGSEAFVIKSTAVSAEEYKDADAEETEADVAPASAPTVLVVEDNVDIQNYIASALRGTYHVLRASNGKEALDVVSGKVPDVVITDLMMPVMSGEELISRLRGDFATSHVLIVALSARSGVSDQIDVYNAGADAYLTKPFSVEHLIAVIESLLRRRQMSISRLAGIPQPSTAMVSQTQESTAEEGDEVNAEQADTSAALSEFSQSLLDSSEISAALPPKDEEFLRNVIKYAEDNYKQNPGVEQFAEHFNMSRTVFYNKVKSLTGKGPLDFVRQIRFKIAADMLRKGYNVSEAAFEIGYSDVKYFSKLFKQIFGYTPSQEKKNGGVDPNRKVE